MTPHQSSVLTKLTRAWEHCPEARFGQLLESIENVAWDIAPQRAYAPRLLWLTDALFEAALDEWNRNPARRVVVAS